LFAFDVQAFKPASQMKGGIEGINSAAGSTNKGDAPSSGIFLSDGSLFTGKYSSPNLVQYCIRRSANWAKLAVEKLVLMLRAIER